MIKVVIPSNNINERKYIIEILFYEFLGLEYKIIVNNEISSISGWIIELANGKKIIFKDYFFNKFINDLEYLKSENIPLEVKHIKNKFITENNIPVIYGSDEIEIKDDEIICEIDIFASSFFMLTRWEEYVNKNRDFHGRFPASESLAFKNNFLDRPIVNEYLEMLWNMLQYLGIEEERKERKFELMLTHDVDRPLKYNRLLGGLGEIKDDIFKRKNIYNALVNLCEKLMVSLGLRKDPYDNFNFLMNISEKNKVKSYFFFMAKGKSKFDNCYKSDDKFINNLIKKINKRGHYIGMHPTYDAYNDFKQFQKEKEELEQNLSTRMEFGREHYLRFEVPTTWQIWENNGMKWDSTVGYADKEGFRCGVCYEYSVFNILTQKKLNLKERPLIVMEGSLLEAKSNIEPEELEIKIKYLMNKVKKYNGEFALLWHNSSFNTFQWKQYQYIYKKILM